MSTLSGKTALVTGASRGISRATALALAKAGARVLVHYGRGKSEAEAVVKTIREGGGRADAVSADLATADGPMKLSAEVRRLVGDRSVILVQQLLPVLPKDGSVVLLSSVVAHAAVGTLSAYAATKGALDTLVKHLASTLGERGIRVNAVAFLASTDARWITGDTLRVDGGSKL